MRKKIVAGNWKMNLDAAESQKLIEELKAQSLAADVTVAVAPPFVHLSSAVSQTSDSSIGVIAQNMHQAKSGAFTGEVSASMLKSVGVHTVLLGHSERRAYFHETDALLAEKVDAALADGLQIIFCFGEDLAERKSNTHFDVVTHQLTEGLFHLTVAQWDNIVLAYEPVWAIGTGETASPAQAQEMHAHIRSVLAAKYDAHLAQAVSVLYGGSVKPANAQELFSQADVDGGLIGGASLNAADFAAIVNAF
jgi:triosephosphate isomerase